MRMAIPEPATIFFSFFVLFVLLFVLAIFPYAPLQDFGEWIYQGYIFNELVSGTVSKEFVLKTYPVPYTLSQILISSTLLLFSPMITSKIVTLIYGIIVVFAIHTFISKARIDLLVGWIFLISVVALNSSFWNGYMGYQLGLIVLLFYLSLSPESRTQALPVLLFSLLAFFAHGMIYASLLVFIGVYSLYDRRILQCAFGLAPSLGLLIWYTVNNGSAIDAEVLQHTNMVAYKIYTFLKAAPYQNIIAFDFNPIVYFGYIYLIAGLFIDSIFVLSLGVLAYAAIARSSFRALASKPEFTIAVILLLVSLALPKVAHAIVNPGERVMYPALIAFAMVVYVEPRLPSAPKATLTAAFVAGYALLVLALVPESLLYKERNYIEAPSITLAPSVPSEGVSSQVLFGHRFMQEDTKMKTVEQAWRTATMPTLPLGFATALIKPKSM